MLLIISGSLSHITIQQTTYRIIHDFGPKIQMSFESAFLQKGLDMLFDDVVYKKRLSRLSKRHFNLVKKSAFFQRG